MPYYISPPPMNPISRLLAAVVAALVMAGAFVLGLAVFAVIFGLILIFWIGFRLRIWWMQKQMGGATRPDVINPGQGSEAKNTGEVIEAEYTVVSRTRD